MTTIDRLIIVDPSDVHFPLALNVFDVGMERLNTLSLAEREQQLAGIIELYDYIFGTIGAELTQKQDVVFRYITRLMLDSTFRMQIYKPSCSSCRMRNRSGRTSSG